MASTSFDENKLHLYYTVQHRIQTCLLHSFLAWSRQVSQPALNPWQGWNKLQLSQGKGEFIPLTLDKATAARGDTQICAINSVPPQVVAKIRAAQSCS